MGDGSKALRRRDFLSLLDGTKSSADRNKLIDVANRECIEALCEILLNVIRGELVIPPSLLLKLKRQKSKVRELTKKSTSLQRKRHLLKQSGGFLPALIPMALSVLGSLVK